MRCESCPFGRFSNFDGPYLDYVLLVTFLLACLVPAFLLR